MDDALRRSSAHVVVADVAAPVLDDGAWHHLSRVLRLRVGDAVTVTDGRGRWRTCRVSGRATLEPMGDVRTEPSPAATTVIVAPPKGDRLEWLVQKCTEVGVGRIVLVEAERSVVRWDDERAAKQRARLAAIAAEAAMQARRVWLPDVEGTRSRPPRSCPGPRWPSPAGARSTGTRPVHRGRARGRVDDRTRWRRRETACRSGRTSCASRRRRWWRPR
jgi:hypothetical protein